MERSTEDLEFNDDLFTFDIPTDIKLQMLFIELDRVEKTIELFGNPYAYVKDPDGMFSIENGRERYARHSVWLQESICGHVDPQCEGVELYDCILSQIRDADLHDRTLWCLCHILAIQGIEELCPGELPDALQ